MVGRLREAAAEGPRLTFVGRGFLVSGPVAGGGVGGWPKLLGLSRGKPRSGSP